MLLFGLSTGHKAGLAVVAATFIAFALASSLFFPRLRPSYPGRGMTAFVVVAFLLFLGMLSAVEVFGADAGEKKAGKAEAPTTTQAAAPTTAAPTTTSAPTATSAPTTTQAAPKSAPKPKTTTVAVTESEFKIKLASTLQAGKVTFNVENAGAIQHNLVIAGAGVNAQTKLIVAGGADKVTATLKPGTYELYCSVPGHKQAGMDLKLVVS